MRTKLGNETMIRHVAVFKWKPGFPDQDLQEWMDRLRALPRQIEVLSSLTVGTDVLNGGRSWDAAVVADVDDIKGSPPTTRTPNTRRSSKSPHPTSTKSSK